MAQAANTIHKFIKHLEPFLGTWKGEGSGFYPTIKSFKYGEEATFTTWGKPVIGYSHKTWNLSNGTPMHYESGFLRVLESGDLELVNAQPTGVTEIDEGKFNNETNTIELVSKSKAPHVTQLKRTFQLADNDTLLVFFDMATTTQPILQRHLEAVLKRAPS